MSCISTIVYRASERKLCSVRCSKSAARLAVPLRVCRRGGTLAARARVSAGLLRGGGRAVRRVAASDGAGEGAREGASAA